MVGGAWPFLVGGLICLVYSDNERDSNLLNRLPVVWPVDFLEGSVVFSHMKVSNNRSVMPLDVRGCTRATLERSACCMLPWPKGLGNPLKTFRDRDRELQLFPFNEEFPVSVSHQLTLITSLPFVHTARRCPGLSCFEKCGDCSCGGNSAAVETILIAMA